MFQQVNPNEMPGIGSSPQPEPGRVARSGRRAVPPRRRPDRRQQRPRPVQLGRQQPRARSSGPKLVAYANALQAGLLMGDFVQQLYGASVSGITQATILASATSLTVPAAWGRRYPPPRGVTG